MSPSLPLCTGTGPPGTNVVHIHDTCSVWRANEWILFIVQNNRGGDARRVNVRRTDITPRSFKREAHKACPGQISVVNSFSLNSCTSSPQTLPLGRPNTLTPHATL